MLGNLHLKFTGDTNSPVTNYRRILDLNNAVTTLDYERDGIKFSREMFATAPAQVMVLRLSANKSKQISFDATLDRPERFETSGDGENGLMMTGQLDNGTKSAKGVALRRPCPRFESRRECICSRKCFEREQRERSCFADCCRNRITLVLVDGKPKTLSWRR